jgi:predicted transposase/invertase (TIGR01784 family)
MALLPIDMDILPASDDRVFKLLLTHPEAKLGLKHLVSAITLCPVIDVLVRNNELPVEDTEEKLEKFDVNCTVGDDMQIDLEMQASRIKEERGNEHKNLKGKSIYYVCDLHSSQSSKGRRYDKLARTYQVTFCSYTIFPERTDFVNPFSIRHDIDNGQLSDAIHVIFVELSKLSNVLEKPAEEMTDIEKWSVFFNYADNPKYREIVNEVIESEEVLGMAATLLMEISKDEKERAIFRSRRMYQSDLESNMLTAEQEGIRIGEQIGLEKGKILAYNDVGLSVMDISKKLGISEETVNQVLSQLPRV